MCSKFVGYFFVYSWQKVIASVSPKMSRFLMFLISVGDTEALFQSSWATGRGSWNFDDRDDQKWHLFFLVLPPSSYVFVPTAPSKTTFFRYSRLVKRFVVYFCISLISNRHILLRPRGADLPAAIVNKTWFLVRVRECCSPYIWWCNLIVWCS